MRTGWVLPLFFCMDLPLQLTPPLLSRAAERFGTPLYVTSAATIRERYARLRGAFPEARIQYAAKANTNPRILEILGELGCCVDAVSLGEVLAAERAGFPADRIMYTGVNPPESELAEVLRRKVLVNADSGTDIERIARLAPGREMGIRVNPQIGAGHHRHVVTGSAGSKFGVPVSTCVDHFRRARELGLDPIGVHMHIGSGITDPEPLVRAARTLAGALDRLRAAGFSLRFVDVGGGLGVPTRPGEEPLDLEALAHGVRDALRTEAKLVVEPGRFLVAESTVLLMRVTAVKDGFVGTDAGINTLLRPALYDAYHHISNLTRPAAPVREVSVVGPICESGDVLGRSRPVPEPRPGDLLAVHTAGAYGFSMASRYNSRPLPAEALVDEPESADGTNGEIRLIRQRERHEDLFERVL